MLVLDYLRYTKNKRTMVIPQFHGHLGFTSGSKVYVNILRSHKANQGSCELYVTPFASTLTNLFRLECRLDEEKGVVEQLEEAVRSLQLNIIKHSSSIVDNKKDHLVEMVLDWHTSLHKEPIESSRSIVHRYQFLGSRIPIDDLRFVHLFELIVCMCGNRIRYDNLSLGKVLPSIRLTPFRPSIAGENQYIEIESATKQKLVTLEIPQEFRTLISRMGGYSKSDELAYILCSEPGTTALRCFFPRKSSIERIFHIGCRHLNLPGASKIIKSMLAASDFNIISSLVRNRNLSDSMFEAIVEYEGDAPIPNTVLSTIPSPSGSRSRHYKELLPWLKKRFEHHADANSDTFDIRLCAPDFPSFKGRPNELTVEASRNKKKNNANVIQKVNKEERLTEFSRSGNVLKTSEGTQTFEARKQVTRLILGRTKRKLPRVFLSYPGYAETHAAQLISKIGIPEQDEEIFVRENPDSPRFVVERYQDPNFQNIVESASARIQNCDFFIGLWHHEGLHSSTSATVSPWMPFEYGIAVASDIPTMILYSELLPKSVWGRIDPSIAKMGYSDLNYQHAVNSAQNHCFEFWFDVLPRISLPELFIRESSP